MAFPRGEIMSFDELPMERVLFLVIAGTILIGIFAAVMVCKRSRKEMGLKGAQLKSYLMGSIFVSGEPNSKKERLRIG